MALRIGTDFGKRTNKISFGKQTKQVGLGKLAKQAKAEKPKPAVIKLLESLSDDRFKSVKKVDTEV
jgi:hypothetical protein